MAQFTDPDAEDFERYLLLPEVNKAAMSVLLDECMAPSDFIATMKAQAFVWSEPDGNEPR